MNSNSDDLWPSDIIDEKTVSPVSLLKEQAARITEKTKKHLIGEVIPVESVKDSRCYGFAVRAPGLKNYVFPIFKITYSLSSLYPLVVENRQIKGEPASSSELPFKQWSAANHADFAEIISTLLKHETTVKAIRSLFAESVALDYNPALEDVPF